MSDDKRKKSDQAEQAAIDKQALQERILSGVKPNVGEATGKWVVDLKSGGPGAVSVPTKYDEEAAEEDPDDMRTWVDKMFDDFERYTFEYNKTVAHGDLTINSERPVFMRSQNPSTKYRTNAQAQQFFQGHLYTRHWALLIKGEPTEVKAYVMPVDFLIGFEQRQDEFKPYFEMRGAKNKKGITVWHIDAVPVNFDAIASISKALFSALVKATKGELQETERFRLSQPEVQSFARTDTTSFLQEHSSPLQKPELQTPSPQAMPPLPIPHFQAPQTPTGSPFQQLQPQQPQMPQQMQQPQQHSAPMQMPPPHMQGISHSQNIQLPQPPAPMGQPSMSQQMPMQQQPQPQMPPQMPMQQQPQQQMPQQMAQMQQPGQQQMQGFMPHPAFVQGQSNHEQLVQRLDEHSRDVFNTCQAASQALLTQLDSLTKIGVAALHAQDMEAVMQVMRRTNSLKALKDKVDGFFHEWNNIVSGK